MQSHECWVHPIVKSATLGAGQWDEILSSYNFVNEHLDGKTNNDNGQSRWPDNEITYSILMLWLLATLAAMTITESYGALLEDIMRVQESVPWVTQVPPTLANVSNADESKWRSIEEAVTYKRTIYVTSNFHFSPAYSHFQALKTAKLIA
jgi:hypothetical protein